MQTWELIFAGEIVDGFVEADVRQKAAQMFKLDPQKIEELFCAKRTVLKKNLEESAAKKYQKLLMKMGMVVFVSAKDTPEKSASEPAENLSSTTDINRDKKNNSKQISVPDWSLGEAGVLLLKKTKPKEPVVTIPNYSLREMNASLLTPEERAKPVQPFHAEIDHMAVQELGGDLLDEYEKEKFQPLRINLEHLCLAEVGEDLLSTNEKTIVDPIQINRQINTNDFSLKDGN